MGAKSKKNLAEVIGIKSIRGGRGVTKAYTKQQAHAHELFVNQSKSQSDTAKIVEVSQATMSKWVNEFNWKSEREAKHLSPMSIHSSIMQNTAELAKQLNKLKWETEPEVAKKDFAKIMDAISKANAVASSIMRQYDSLGGILHATDELISWISNNDIIKKNHPDLIKQLELYLPAFSRAMAEKYG